MRLLLLPLLFFLCLPPLSATKAEPAPQKTILVLDASGSMWGQIEGITKIEIARTVVGDLLQNTPSSNLLGLTAYGHNREGDCSDIETIVAPAANTKEAILTAVNTIKPKGKTPLSAAVMKAAEDLDYTKGPATVILVSDGKETCDFDPCEVGTSLEKNGVDFTAHVVGFDVKNIEDQKQLKCLAENTGGKFLTADNADELTKALETVTKTAPASKPVVEKPKPLKFDTHFTAVEEETKLTINNGLSWAIYDANNNKALLQNHQKHALAVRLAKGTYRVSVTREKDQKTAEITVKIDENAANKYSLELPIILPEATITAPSTATIGSILQVEWTGPNNPEDTIRIRQIGSNPEHANPETNRTSNGSPLALQMPGVTGQYEIVYLQREDGDRYRALTTHPITLMEASASISAAPTAKAGAELSVNWTGPNNARDYIKIQKTGESRPQERTATKQGSPLQLQVPSMPGDYELLYVLGESHKTIYSTKITVEDVAATLNAPTTAKASSAVSVNWTGPNYKRDDIMIVKAGTDKRVSGIRVSKGSPLELKMPKEPGQYELVYRIGTGGYRIIARRPITVR